MPSSGASRDVVWLRWMMQTVDQLGEPGPERVAIRRDNPKLAEFKSEEYPRLSDRGVARYRDALRSFAEHYVPSITKRGKRPTTADSRTILRYLPGILKWACEPALVGILGTVTLTLRIDRGITIDYDDVFLMVRKFVELASTNRGRFRKCKLRTCRRPFIAARSERYCEPRHGGRERARRHKAMKRETPEESR
jgi:hypothetical protein